jgi:hypothetical protein
MCRRFDEMGIFFFIVEFKDRNWELNQTNVVFYVAFILEKK